MKKGHSSMKWSKRFFHSRDQFSFLRYLRTWFSSEFGSRLFKKDRLDWYYKESMRFE